MTVTLKDVAKRAGVSVKTASNVVRGYEHVTEKVRTRVQAAIAELHYRPNVSARHLRTKRTGVLALATPILNNPYFTEIAQAFTQAARQRGYTVLLDYTAGQREEELLVLNGLRPHIIDGILLHPFSLELEDLQEHNSGIPVVLSGERLLDIPYDHISIDNVAAAYQATEHLYRLGRRRIAVIGVQAAPMGETARLRLQGYRQSLDAAGLPYDERLLIEVTKSYTREDGYQAVQYLLTLQPLPDALFCFNDLMALGAMRALLEAGYRIPEDLAVVGFDDIEDARFATPALTTISPNKQRIGELSVSLLHERIQDAYQGPPRHLEVPFQLIARESTLGRTNKGTIS